VRASFARVHTLRSSLRDDVARLVAIHQRVHPYRMNLHSGSSAQVPPDPSKPEGERQGWRVAATRYLYQSAWFDLRSDEVRLPNGQDIVYTYVEHPGFVSIVPLTDAGEIILIRSYRYTVDDWAWEVPAGGIGNKPQMSLQEVAASELLEEVGCVAKDWAFVTSHYSAIGHGDTEAHVFFATGVQSVGAQDLEATELIEVHPMPARQVLRMARSGEIRDGASALALLLCAERIEAALSGDRDAR
jgi:ADP-ribose pyrophosphatase